MEIKQEQRGGVVVLAPSGRLDTDSSTDLELMINDLIAADARHFVVDLGQISYVSSAGLRVLLASAKQLDGGKGSVRLCGLNPQVKQVFDVAGFTKLFGIFSNAEAALAQHPNIADAAPALGKLAGKLMGAAGRQQAAGSGGASVANAAAALLGAKAAPKVAGPGKGEKSAVDRTMALKSVTRPTVEKREQTAESVPEPKKKLGFWARLFGRKG
jgi:anti-anti-sigma factor